MITSTVRTAISILIFGLIFSAIACDSGDLNSPSERTAVVTGAERLITYHLDEIQEKRVGLVMNPTAVVDGVHMLDTLLARGVNITALYAPEHGFRGEAGAGERIEDGADQQTGLPVYSLYGQTRKPTPEMLRDVDLLLFDMQDVGARFYTYHATMGLVIEAAADAGLPVWILDRPNPLGGEYISGWIREDEFTSFVGPYAMPVAHGMTLGELAKMMVGKQWLDTESDPKIRIIEMEGWSREMLWPDTGLPWIAPSPNLPTFEHAYVYLGTCLIEGTTMSEGRGTEDPFLLIGSPSTRLDEENFERMNQSISGGRVSPAVFTPESIPGVAPSPKHEGEESYGIRVHVDDYTAYEPFENGLIIIAELMQHSPEAETNNFLYRLAGTRKIDQVISGEASPQDADFELDEFKEARKNYLIY
ncbi:DUF1343 domain-containing protein [Rhodohalobacter sp. SW132]|uniref:exo-beta-N-acetylmuramidase NamZ family protein n=1 Tax=Rhodohalobacter sp. SW132 TaxID=2293433 RepID=UPI000E288619|nr:DUF1343 domain-containing protein [Rhodohalobacter sp. SW132]REL33376.1 DUF1343 domain-containing protein [Rhodohalobacter sp. SW132]